jgi:biotin carboxyl carrier protein
VNAHIAVIAPRDIGWIRAAAGSMMLIDEDVATAHLVVTAPEYAAAVLAHAPGSLCVIIGEPVEAADPRIAHFIRRGIPLEHAFALLASLAGGRPYAPLLPEPDSPMAARTAQRAFVASRRLAAATDLADAEAQAVAAVIELCAADRAHCLFHDPDDGGLWSEALMRESGDDRRSTAGLVGFAARTGLMAFAERVEQDRRWVAAIDDPTGEPGGRLLVQPIASPSGAIHAILVAARGSREAAFTQADADLLARYAGLAGPFLDQLSSHRQAQEIAHEGADPEGLFRTEAVEAQGETRWGDVIRVTPMWMSRAYWLLVALLVGSAAYLWVGTVATYSSGPAVIRATARAEVVARTAGNITAVEGAPGEQVAAGAVIARLDDQNQRAALDRAEEEFDSQLRNHMLDPSDSAADGALRALRQARDAARSALEERVVRAAASGAIADMRVHPGQHVQPGDIVASLVQGEGGLEVIALLPGEDRPQLAPGMSVRLELLGYRYSYQSFQIDSVTPDVIGPSEARRVVGPEVADGLKFGGPVVLVRGRLQRDVFDSDGRTFRYHDGMLGSAEVRVRLDRILFSLFPWLKGL